MWSIGRIILTGKNQNTQRKTWPSATLSTTKPIRTGLQVNPGVCGERPRTNSQSHLPTARKVTQECFLLHRSALMCGTTCSTLQIQAVYWLRSYVTETATQLFCLKLAMCAKYRISNIWTIFFNIQYPSLLTKEHPVKTVYNSLFWWQLEMTARNLHVISVPQIKWLTTETGDPIFPVLKVYFKH